MIKTEWHQDHMEPLHLAVNVKVYNRNRFDKIDTLYPYYQRIGWTYNQFNDFVEVQFEMLSEEFWSTIVQEIAKECGFGQVWSEGRSGGWAVPTLLDKRSITQDLVDPEILKQYTEFRKQVKDIVANAGNTLYDLVKEFYSDQELLWLKQHSVYVQAVMV